MTQAYPLQWPNGVPRTPAYRRANSRFDATIATATADLLNEVRLMGGSLLVISTNVELRNDGMPYSSRKAPDDVGVAVYFQRRRKSLVFACDRWTDVGHNMRAIAKTIEALRGIERWGSADMVDQAFTGFAALPTPEPDEHWTQVLNLPANATIDQINQHYRARVKDVANDGRKLLTLNLARDAAKAARSLT